MFSNEREEGRKEGEGKGKKERKKNMKRWKLRKDNKKVRGLARMSNILLTGFQKQETGKI